MERPDNITGALRYGAKRERRQQERRQTSLLGGNRPGVFDADYWGNLPENVATQAVEGVIGTAVGGVVEDVGTAADNWFNGDTRREKALFTASERPTNFIYKTDRANDYASRLQNLVNNNNGNLQEALLQMNQQTYRDAFKRQVAAGKVAYQGKVLTLNDLSDTLIDTITYEERNKYAESILPHAQKVLEYRSAGDRANLVNLFKLHNLRPDSKLGQMLDGKTTEELDDESWENITKTKLYQDNVELQNAYAKASATQDLSYINEAISKVKLQDKIASQNFDIVKTTSGWEDGESGESNFVIRNFNFNRFTGKNELVDKSIVDTRKLSTRDILKSIPIKSVIQSTGLNKRSQIELFSMLNERFRDAENNPIVWSRLHEYDTEKDIIKTRNAALSLIQTYTANAGQEQWGVDYESNKLKVINALITDRTKEMLDADATQSDIIKMVNADTATMNRIMDVNAGLLTYVPMNRQQGVSVKGVEYGKGAIYTGEGVPVGFDVQRYDDGTIKFDEAGEVTLVPSDTVPLKQRALNYYIFERYQAGRGKISSLRQKEFLDNLTEEDLNKFKTKKEKEGGVVKPEDGEFVETEDGKFVETGNELDVTADTNLQELAKDSTAKVVTGASRSRRTQTIFNPDKRVTDSQGKKPTYKEISNKVEADLLANPSYVARNISGEVAGMAGKSARRLKNSYEKLLKRAGYSLADAEKVSKWYAANQKDIIAAVGTNQELYDLFVQQGSAGLYKRFNPEKKMQSNPSSLLVSN